MGRRRVLVLPLSLLIAGCGPNEPPRPSTPPVPSEVSKIDTLEFRVGKSEGTHDFTNNPAVIQGLLTYLKNHPDGWTLSKEKPPEPQRTVTFYSGQIALLEVYVGADWIGGRLPEYAADEFRKRPLTEPEKAELRRIIDGPR